MINKKTIVLNENYIFAKINIKISFIFPYKPVKIYNKMEFIVAIITLTFLEIVLGIDNIIFISIVTNKLPKEQQSKARFLGLSFALIFRILLLLGIVWIIQNLNTFFLPLNNLTHEQTLMLLEESKTVLEKIKIIPHAVGFREVILFIGGVFLLTKTVSEVHHKMEGKETVYKQTKKSGLFSVIIQIILLDIVFSFDSILTAVGITENKPAMISAIVIAMIVMMFFSKYISNFISNHPSLEMLALAFLILIGFLLTLESVHAEVPKGYIYFAIFFSLIVELINMRIRKKSSKTV